MERIRWSVIFIVYQGSWCWYINSICRDVSGLDLIVGHEAGYADEVSVIEHFGGDDFNS